MIPRAQRAASSFSPLNSSASPVPPGGVILAQCCPEGDVPDHFTREFGNNRLRHLDSASRMPRLLSATCGLCRDG